MTKKPLTETIARKIISNGEPHFQFDCDLWIRWNEALFFIRGLEAERDRVKNIFVESYPREYEVMDAYKKIFEI